MTWKEQKQASVVDMEKDADRLFKKAEEKSDFGALSAVNGLRS